MGDVKNQSLIRMVQTWGGNALAIQYTHELFNYFGDPAMEIKTANPTPIYASCGDTINCHNDTSFHIASTFDGMATLVVNNELISKAQIINGVAILYFRGIAGTTATITISGHNKIPFSKNILIEGGCSKAKITAKAIKYCLQDSVLITNLSTGAIASRIWNFGSGASPSSSTSNGPFYIQYSTSGIKTITLSITDSSNHTVSCSTSFNMNQYCEYTIPTRGAEIINKCSGKLYDNGGVRNYSANSNGMTTISPSGASAVILNFSSFNFEIGYDSLKIYDGPNKTSPLIGSYSGSTLPGNGQITSTSSSITLYQHSDDSVNMSGFELLWQCVPVGLQTNTSIVSFKLFPVPAHHNLQIEFESSINQNLDIQITDIAGKVIFTSNRDFISGKSNYLIDVSQFAQGVYSLKLSGNSGNIIRKFIVI